jgi:hypothetical protein
MLAKGIVLRFNSLLAQNESRRLCQCPINAQTGQVESRPKQMSGNATNQDLGRAKAHCWR